MQEYGGNDERDVADAVDIWGESGMDMGDLLAARGWMMCV